MTLLGFGAKIKIGRRKRGEREKGVRSRKVQSNERAV
jgi:hypothetical protein